VLEVQGELVFTVDVGPRSAFGAELEGPYTAPDHRRRGYATLSLGQVSRQLLASLPRLTLRFDEGDAPGKGVAQKVGYVAAKAQKLVIAD
jgi:predicted GNAT family acetyltransferase